MPIKLCKDCVYFYHYECKANFDYISCVDGENRYLSCAVCRKMIPLCGPDAKYFKPRPTLLAKIKKLWEGK